MNLKKALIILAIVVIVALVGYIVAVKLAFSGGFLGGVVAKSEEIKKSSLGDEFLFRYVTRNFPDLDTTVTVFNSDGKEEILYFVIDGDFYKSDLSNVIDSSGIRCYEIYKSLLYKVGDNSFKGIVINRIAESEPSDYNSFTDVAKAMVATKQWRWIEACGSFLLKAGDEDTRKTLERYAKGQFSQEELDLNKNSKISKEYMQVIAEQILQQK